MLITIRALLVVDLPAHGTRPVVHGSYPAVLQAYHPAKSLPVEYIRAAIAFCRCHLILPCARKDESDVKVDKCKECPQTDAWGSALRTATNPPHRLKSSVAVIKEASRQRICVLATI
jgi:hypothetical protein